MLRAHPEYLRDEVDGSDIWMWMAAMDGKLPIIQALVELGMDVNETKDHGDPDDPFYEPEGAIVQAAAKGHLEVVRWLLEHGAKINYVVHGERRCLALVDAATNGHLEVVKLLVEHGADIHATWQGINAVTQAEDFGQFAVRDYLRSLGARTLRENTPPDYASAHKRFLNELTERVGPLGEWRLEIPGDPAVTLHRIPANKKCHLQSLFTVGLSDHPLREGRYEHAYAELRCILAPDWPFTKKALRDAKWNWPVEWLKRIFQHLRTAERWPEPAVFMNGDPPVALGPETELTGWIALKSQEETIKAPDYSWIGIYSLFPIYTEEAELIRQIGHEELVNRLQHEEVPLEIDPKRPNMGL